MTWFTTEDGYELFFNRDERLSRSRAESPAQQSSAGIHYISPTDADAGGTWIAVNEYGVTVCLLNHYQFEQIATYKDWVSRGEVVRAFSTTIELSAAIEQFENLVLEDYRAFRMFLIDKLGNNILCVWDGHTGRIERNVTTPKSSSSVDAKHVKQTRNDFFTELNLLQSKNTQDYLNFHASHLPNCSQESVCMHRNDAKTVSLSHVKVSAESASFAYADGSPCEALLGPELTLAIVSSEMKPEPSKVLNIA
jgi:hypothetical protein